MSLENVSQNYPYFKEVIADHISDALASLGKGTEGVMAGARQLDRYAQIGEKYHLLLERMEKCVPHAMIP